MPEIEEIKFEISKYLPQQQSKTQFHNDWIVEPEPLRLSPLKTKTLPFPIVLFVISIIALAVIWQSHNASQSLITDFTKPMQTNLNTQINEIQRKYQQSIQTQIDDKKVLESTQSKQLILQQQALQKQNQRLAEAKREETIKEELWNEKFKNNVACTDNDGMVKCGNDYIKNKNKFEAFWEANKSRFLNKN